VIFNRKDFFNESSAMKTIWIFLCFLFITSCRVDVDEIVKYQVDNQGVVIATPYLWRAILHQKEPVSNGVIKFPILYHDNVLVPATNGVEGCLLSLINTKDGSVLWHWSDLFYDTEFNDVYFFIQNKNLFTYQNGSRSYCINMDNGLTHWKNMRDRIFDIRLDSFGQSYFTYASITNNDGYDEQIAFKGDIQSGEITEYLTANFTYEHHDCVRAVCSVVQVPDRENLVVVYYAENLPDWITQSYFGLYNTESKEWVWDKIAIAPPQIGNVLYYQPQIVNNKIYAEIGCSIVCHDLESGKQLWKRDFTNDFTFSGFIIEDGRLIGNNEDCFTVCLDPETGREHWRTSTAGTCGSMSYLNGIVYFAGGSDRKLFAIEARTGKIVWRINPKILEADYWAQFNSWNAAQFRYNAVYVLPAKGREPAKVIALTDMYAYCFEAYQ